MSRTGTAPFSIDYVTANGSATAGFDYAAIPLTTLSFAAGEASRTIAVTINGDTTIEGNETFSVNLSNATGPGASIVDGTGVGTILDDDSPPVTGSISVNDVSLSEGDSGTKLATFTISRTGGTAAFAVDYATSNGSATAGSDYVAIPLTTLNFAAGETAKTVLSPSMATRSVEGNETFSLNLSNAVGPGATIADATGAGTIVNDDSAPVVGNISINDVSLSEGNSGTKLATFTVSRAGGTAAFSVNYATANGSATAGSDYVALASTTLNFAAGDTARTISVTINGDTNVEGNEPSSSIWPMRLVPGPASSMPRASARSPTTIVRPAQWSCATSGAPPASPAHGEAPTRRAWPMSRARACSCAIQRPMNCPSTAITTCSSCSPIMAPRSVGSDRRST